MFYGIPVVVGYLMLNLVYICIGIMVRDFANSPDDLDSIRDRVIPKTQKMIFDASLLITQHYKVRIKSRVGQ